MMPIRNLNIAVIGDEDLVSGLRLAGVNRYYVIENNQDTGEDVLEEKNILCKSQPVKMLLYL